MVTKKIKRTVINYIELNETLDKISNAQINVIGQHLSERSAKKAVKNLLTTNQAVYKSFEHQETVYNMDDENFVKFCKLLESENYDIVTQEN